jgi:HPt (histidine-containing phosphotransfer) domain-containing protein
MNNEQPAHPSEDFSPTAFNLSITMETVMDSEELFQTIADLLIESYPGYIERISNAISENDPGVLEREAHSLKGAVGNFGADDAYEAAYHLEKLGKSGSMATAEKGLSNLEKTFDILISEMKIVLGRMSR